MSRVTETKILVQEQSQEWKCRLYESVCNSKQKWNHDDCQCECKELDDWGSCKNIYMWNPSTCDCQCNETYKSEEYLDIRKYLCKKRLFGKLTLECEDEILNTPETLLNEKK